MASPSASPLHWLSHALLPPRCSSVAPHPGPSGGLSLSSRWRTPPALCDFDIPAKLYAEVDVNSDANTPVRHPQSASGPSLSAQAASQHGPERQAQAATQCVACGEHSKRRTDWASSLFAAARSSVLHPSLTPLAASLLGFVSRCEPLQVRRGCGTTGADDASSVNVTLSIRKRSACCLTALWAGSVALECEPSFFAHHTVFQIIHLSSIFYIVVALVRGWRCACRAASSFRWSA